MNRTLLSSALAGAVLSAVIPAQHARFEVGLRVRAFEHAFAPHIGEVAMRRRVLPQLEAAVRGFFSGNLGSVAASIDAATAALDGAPDGTKAVARRFAASLELRPSTRCVDPSADKPLTIGVRQVYRAQAPEAGVVLDWRLTDVRGSMLGSGQGLALDALPLEIAVGTDQLPEGDHALQYTVRDGETVLAKRSVVLSCIRDARKRLDALRTFTRSTRSELDMERATLAEFVRLLRITVLGRSLETDFEAHASMCEAESLRAWLERDPAERGAWFANGVQRSTFCGFVGRARGRSGVVPARIFVPRKEDSEPRPLVVALAGAGATANMWFDSYGAGAIVEECRRRGWICVARASSGFDPALNVEPMVQAIAKRWPVDRARVFLVGHSMGAMMACRTAARLPSKFRAVVALGGGGTTGRGDAFRKVAFFVAPGDRDFARAGARALAKSLERKGQPELRYREYEDAEHFGIVQIALPDAFRWLDALE